MHREKGLPRSFRAISDNPWQGSFNRTWLLSNRLSASHVTISGEMMRYNECLTNNYMSCAPEVHFINCQYSISLSDIDSLHRVNYDLLKPIIFCKLNGNNSSQPVRGISGGQFISDLKLINCLFNWLLSVLVIYLMLTIWITSSLR